MSTLRIRVQVPSSPQRPTPFFAQYGWAIQRVAPDPSSGVACPVRTLVVRRDLWTAEVAAYPGSFPYVADVDDNDPIGVLDGY